MGDELLQEITIGFREDDHLSIRVMGRLHPEASDYWDANWLASPIEVFLGGFRGTVGASLRTDELNRFRGELTALHDSLAGEAQLKSLEEWLSLTIAITNLGQLSVSGSLCDRPGVGNRLRFTINGLDQSCLPEIIQDLASVEAAFPVIGTPESAGDH